MKVYLLVEITDYDCTDEETIMVIYSNYTKALENLNKLKTLETNRVSKNPERYPYNFFYEIREYEVIE